MAAKENYLGSFDFAYVRSEIEELRSEVSESVGAITLLLVFVFFIKDHRNYSRLGTFFRHLWPDYCDPNLKPNALIVHL